MMNLMSRSFFHFHGLSEVPYNCSPLAAQFIGGEPSGLVGRFVGGEPSGLVGRFIGGEPSGLVGRFVGGEPSGFVGRFVGGEPSGFVGRFVGSEPSGFVGRFVGGERSGFVGRFIGGEPSGLVGRFIGGEPSGLVGRFVGSEPSGFVGRFVGSERIIEFVNFQIRCTQYNDSTIYFRQSRYRFANVTIMFSNVLRSRFSQIIRAIKFFRVRYTQRGNKFNFSNQFLFSHGEATLPNPDRGFQAKVSLRETFA
jgi:hypothetical protein